MGPPSFNMGPAVPHVVLALLTLTTLHKSVLTSLVFTPSEQHPLEKMTLDVASGDIYLGALNRIYHLSADLKQLDQATLGPQMDSPHCWMKTECQYEKTLNDQHIKVLLLNNPNRTLLVCGTLYKGACLTLPIGNLSDSTWIYKAVVGSNRNQPYRQTVALDNGNDQIFIANSLDTESSAFMNSPSIPLISTRNKSLSFYSSLASLSKYNILEGQNFKAIYRYGFRYNGYFYSISNQKGNNYNTFSTYLGRVCEGDTQYRSYVETPLYCDSNGDRYDVLTSAHLGPAGQNLTQLLGLNVDERLLYGVFTKSVDSPRGEMPSSVVCIYRVTVIDHGLIKAVRRCFGGLGNTGPSHLTSPKPCVAYNMKIAENYCGENSFNYPIRSAEGVSPVVRSTVPNVSISAIHSSTLGLHTLLYMGTTDGHLLKATVEAHSTVKVYDTLDVDQGRSVLPDMFISTDGARVYAMSQRKLVRFDMSCGHHVECEDCMQAADPHCGWCFRTNRCLSKELCSAEAEDWGWVQTRAGSCPAIVKTKPDKVPTASNINLELKLSELPKFPADMKCIIGADAGQPGQRVEASLVDNTKWFICEVNGKWPQLRENDYSKLVSVHLEVNRVRWLSTNFTLFDCLHHNSCTSCTSSEQPCAWCVQSQRCTDAATVSLLEKCGHEDFIYSINASASTEFPQAGPGFCPTFKIRENEKPQLHAKIQGDFQLSASNIPQVALKMPILCHIGNTDFTASVAKIGDDYVITCSNVKLSYRGEQPFHNEPIQVLLGDKKSPIDNPHNATLMLYTCEYMAVSCGQCLTLDSIFGCGYCEGYCSPKDSCPTTWLDKSNVCPNPRITRVLPVAGPVGGGTRLTIHGVNLGQEEEHIQNGVKVAGQPCEVVHYSPSTRIECLTPPSNHSLSGNITITVNGSDGQVYRAKALVNFTYVDPVLNSVHPGLGPRSGGSKVTISGQHLDVGSDISIDIQTKDEEKKRRKREAESNTTVTPIISRDSESIVFKSPRVDSGGNTTFVVVMDGNRFTSDSVTFQYVPDPTITDVSNINTLTIGGTELQVKGQRIQLIQHPELVVYVDDRAVKSRCYYKTNHTDLSCVTPDLTSAGLDPEVKALPYGFVMDDVRELLKASEMNPHLQPLSVHPTPSLDPLPDNLRYTEGEPLEFFGSHLYVLSLFPDAGVTIGEIPCNITQVDSDKILCHLPTTPTHLSDGAAQVVLTVLGHQNSPGSVIIHNVGLTLFMLILIIAAITVPILIIIIIIAVCLRRQNKKEKLRRFQQNSVPGCIEDPAAIPLRATQTEELGTVNRTDGADLNGEKPSEMTPLRRGDPHELDALDMGPQADCRPESYMEVLGEERDDIERRVLDQISDPRLRETVLETIIPSHLITLGDVLGKGHFGCVYSGTLSAESGRDRKIKVAVKTLQGRNYEPAMIESFLKEGVMMKNFDHPNVLELLGVSLGEQPLVILPFMAQGDLRTYVKNKQKNFTARQLLRLAQQVAQGMAYLASRYFVHRDLAARNCMIDEDDQVKVADFGLSKDLYEKDYYSSKDRKRKLPIKWMALESLEDYLFTTKSDVWSFGVLMWELITRGVTPYPDVDAFEMRNYLASGRRLRQPKFCPDNAYILMAECWETRPEDRPTFADLVNRLELIVNPPRRLNSSSSDEPLYMNIHRQPSLPNELEEEK